MVGRGRTTGLRRCRVLEHFPIDVNRGGFFWDSPEVVNVSR